MYKLFKKLSLIWKCFWSCNFINKFNKLNDKANKISEYDITAFPKTQDEGEIPGTMEEESEVPGYMVDEGDVPGYMHSNLEKENIRAL